jgi:hypothetical protein
MTTGRRIDASYRVVGFVTGRGSKPHEFESPNTKMRRLPIFSVAFDILPIKVLDRVQVLLHGIHR